jgi:hypothetical protein
VNLLDATRPLVCLRRIYKANKIDVTSRLSFLSSGRFASWTFLGDFRKEKRRILLGVFRSGDAEVGAGEDMSV